jgi:uncharacterized membrane protein YphA (DoxX/SURF4 family)
MAVESTTTTTIIHPSTPASVGLLLARVPLGLYFIMAAIAKFRGGVAGFVSSQMETAKRFMSESLAHQYLNALPYVELVLGIFLVVGLLTRFTAGVMAVLMVSFTIALGADAALGRTLQMPFHPNFVYIGTALAIMLCGPGWISVDGMLFSPRRRWVAPPTDEFVNERPAGL